MSTTTSNMSLIVPATGESNYPTSISSSMTLIDAHDHTSGKGVQIPTGGIVDASITAAKLASNSVTTAKIVDASVTRAKLASVGQQFSANFSDYRASFDSGFVDITNATLSITTTGRPVVIGIAPRTSTLDCGFAFTYGAASFAALAFVKLLRDSTDVLSLTIGNSFTGGTGSTATYNAPASSVFLIDVPSAGTYTYKLQAQFTTGFDFLAQGRLFAYEL